MKPQMLIDKNTLDMYSDLLLFFYLNSTDIGLAHLAEWSPRIFIPEQQETENASTWFTILYLFIDNPKRLMSKSTKIADLLTFLCDE